MLPCAMAMDSSAAPSAALAAVTERPSAVRAAMVEWGTVPQTPIATTMSGSKVHECGSRAPGTRRSIEAHGFRRSHGSYLACLRPNSCTEVGVVSDGEFDGNDDAPVVVKTVQVGAKWVAGVIVVVGR